VFNELYLVLEMVVCVIVVTFQSTFFHDSCCRRPPWVEIVENNVCPALFLTAGLESTHNSPRRVNRHIHSWSNDDMY